MKKNEKIFAISLREANKSKKLSLHYKLMMLAYLLLEKKTRKNENIWQSI
jgi:hypothetical protein